MLSSREKEFLKLKESLLPFVIKVAETEEELMKVAKVRSDCYKRHLPELGESFRVPEVYDYDPSFTSLMVLSKLDQTCLGTVRIQIVDGNSDDQLLFESSHPLGDQYRLSKRAEMSRLAISGMRDSLTVKTCLVKAVYWFCRFNRVKYGFFCARKPVDRLYTRYDFSDLDGQSKYFPMRHIGDVPHRILCFDVMEQEEVWLKKNNPLYELFRLTLHPDIVDGIQQKALLFESQIVDEKYA